ncbi:MAG: SDR family NAD(P)-dependent oxidoreductase, partial [Alphaproteobacteria bacterium]
MSDGAGRLAGRISLITGASRGIGAAVARRFAAEGSHVILVARTVGGLEEADDAIRTGGGIATLMPMDLTEFEKIDRMGAAVAERCGRLDVLVGNAGILGTLSPMGHIEPQAWDQVIAINLTANWRLIRSLDPLLRASGSGRAIFVTSGAADGVHPYWGAYAVSKAALEAMVRTWAGEVTKTPLKVNLVDPGALRTRMRAEAYPGEDPMTLEPPEA